VDGKHEPSSRTSFYLSLSTAALRATLVLGVIALGVFVLAKAFPTGAGGVPPIPVETTEETSPPEDGGDGGNGDGGTGTGGETPQPPDVSDLEIQVLNGTDVSGLAECTATELEELEGFADVIFGDAQGSSYPKSRISYRNQVKDVAQYLEQTYFSGAELQTAVAGTDVNLSVILGDDYAEKPLPGVQACLG
jgi:hypothetical protein